MADDDAVMLIDGAGRIIEWRRPAEEIFGRSATETVGRPVAALMGEMATADAWHKEQLSSRPRVVVQPVLRGASVVWEVLRLSAEPTTAADLAILRAMFTQSPVSLAVLDQRLRVVRINTATRRLLDTPPEHVIGQHLTEAFVFEEPGAAEAVARGVLRDGEPALNRLFRGAQAPGLRKRIYALSFVRLENRDGEVLGLVVSAIDVTEREVSRQRLAALDSVRARVGRHLDVVAVCDEFVEAVVPAFSGSAVVEVVEDVVRGETPPLAPVDGDLPLRRAAFRGHASDCPVGDVRPLPFGTPFSRVLSDLRPRLVPVEEGSLWLSADPVRGEEIRRSGAHSLIVAPLTLRGEVLGVASFYGHQDEDPFTEEDLALASDVCAHTALCIDNARRYARERTIAATVHRRLLPQHPQTPTTVEISPLHLPGPQGGGSWFDVIALPGARTALVAGDISGHGIAAATTMGQLRTAIHALAALNLPPDELLARLSSTAVRLAAERAAPPPGDPLHDEPLTATCGIAVYDPVDRNCTIVSAGFPQPVAVFPDGSSVTLSIPAGPPLGTAAEEPFPATTVDLPEGSTLAMGTSVLADEVLSPTGPLRPLLDRGIDKRLPDLCDTIAYALKGGGRTDESLMLLARTSVLPSSQVLSRPLPHDLTAAPIARRETRRQLDIWGVDEETAFTTELIVSELVGNAIRYGAAPLQLRLIFDRMLTCEVSDGAMSAPLVKHARTVDESGRGLFIVASLAELWGVRYHAEGKTVWAERPTGHVQGT
ncbi:SpoIIE family protein phosphatase [Streptomyces sp. NPDC052101]|uniref:ATP-binding SpoIIE family protein phosphatase n=1 Tax=Streptomyces sp. NPDC052101 TaxID=3155763 RepID=UPI003443DDFA